MGENAINNQSYITNSYINGKKTIIILVQILCIFRKISSF